MKSEINVRMSRECLPALLDLGHDGIDGRHCAWSQGEITGKVYVGSDAAESRGPACRFRGLCEHLLLPPAQ